ncbi:Coiled-coil domain-containing protein 39, partial [Quaeritorhiza haematococci]
MLSLDDNFHAYSLPPFANEVNKKLSQEIREKEVALSNITATLEDNVSRAEAMEAHKKNVQQELLHTQALYDARTRQIETETHFKQLAERESGRLAQEIKRIEKEMADITDHLNTVQNNIYAGNERIETLRTTLKLSKQELASWLQIQSEKEEDSLTILKYAAADDARIRSLNLQIEKLLTQVNKKKNLLSAEVTETQVAQIELDKTTEEFKRLHASRLELIQKWEEAVKEMKERDKEIEQAREREREIKEEMKRLRKVIEEKQAFLEQQLATNAETEKKIGICDRNVGKYRMEQTEANVSLSQFQDELEVLRNTLNKTATDLVNKRAEIVNMKSDLSERQQRLEKENAHRMETKNRLMLLTDETVSMEAKAQELQNILKQEEFRSKELERELKILREQQFKRNQELFKLKQDEKNLLAEQAGGEAALKNLKSRINKLDQETQKQQALLYTQEFQIQQLERKVRRAQGDRTDEEKEVLMQKIEALNNQLEEQTRKWNLLNGQLKKSQDDLRHAKRRLEVLQKERATVIENIDELNLYNESA